MFLSLTMDKYGRQQRVQVEKWLTVFEIPVHQGERTENPLHLLAGTITAHIAADLFSLP